MKQILIISALAALPVAAGCSSQYEDVETTSSSSSSSSTGGVETLQAPALDTGTTGPIGLGAVTAFSQLPYLRTAQYSGHDSSYDRSGGNNDMSLSGNYLYSDSNGDKVLMDAVGPGCVYRMWFTGQNASQLIHIYFDGETTPRINMTLADFFSGTKAPFLAPLVGPDSASSGGFYSYLPLPYAKSIRITASGGTPDFYYNFDYHTYDSSQAVTSFTGQEDSSAARAMWNQSGADPKGNIAGTVSNSALIALGPGQAQTVLDVAGPGQVTAIKASIGGVFPVHPVSYEDSGRAHKGTSQFTVAVDPNNQGVVLQRRLDFSVADQSVDVYVDNTLAGTWTDRGSDTTNHWRDEFFPVPAALTAGKSKITVSLRFKSSALDFNEFFYWIWSRVNGAEVQTDSVDVANTASESAHAYSITNQTWTGDRTYNYPQGAQFAATLNSIWVRITWNGDAQPSVDAPLGSFFAQGQFGTGYASGIAAGMNFDGTMYMFFPMPYAQHAKVEFVNKAGAQVNDIWYDVRHAPFSGSFDNVGVFKVAYNTAQPSTGGADLLFVDTEGAGQVVGVVQSEQGPANSSFLEGDERVRIDDRTTPSLHGTGTEDFYNGGWYFNRGYFSLPSQGFVNRVSDANSDARAMYRFFVSDAIPFRKHIRMSIEHGPVDDVSANAWTLAYYYYQPAVRATLSDSFEVGDANAESSHQYTIGNQTWQGARTFTCEGELDTVSTSSSGRAHEGTSTFNLAVDPSNHGVILRRLLDQTIGRQRARVTVEGTVVGDFYTPGTNSSHQWRQAEIAIPGSLTAGKSRIAVKIDFESSNLDYNEFEYWAYSILK